VGALGDVEICEPAAYEHMVDNKKAEFLEKFPHGKIPAWEGQHGFKLFEGVVIARYGERCRNQFYRGLLG
jgi:elongation factor 1-gamma